MKYERIPYNVQDREWYDAKKAVPLCQGETDYSNYVSAPCVIYTDDKRFVLAAWDDMNQQWISVTNHKVEIYSAVLWAYAVTVLFESVDEIIKRYEEDLVLHVAKAMCKI